MFLENQNLDSLLYIWSNNKF